MPLDEERRQRLERVLQRETNRGYRMHAPGPSTFRKTALDTHETVPAAYFGPSPDLVQQHRETRRLQLAQHGTGRRTRLNTSQAQARSSRIQEEPDVQYQSVFKPQPAQEHSCALAREHRAAIANSEWALLDSLQAALCNDEHDQRHKARGKAAAALRLTLDAQVLARQEQEQQEAKSDSRYQEVMHRDMDTMQQRDVIKSQQQRDARVQLKNEQMAMIAAAQRAKQQALMQQRQEEERLVAQDRAKLREERLAAAAKAAALRKEMQETVAQNEAKRQLKVLQEGQQKQLDEEMMRERLRNAEQVDRQRQRERQAFLARCEHKTSGVYDQVRTEQVMKHLQAEALDAMNARKKEEDEQRRLHEARLKKERLRQELIEARQEALANKARRAQKERAADLARLQAMAAWDRAAAEEQERGMQILRAQARENQAALRAQIQERELAMADQDVGMTAAERQLNHKLLKVAVKKIGAKPKQREVFW